MWWSRSTPGWICITSPSSHAIPAVTKSMCAAKACTSSGLTGPANARAYSTAAAVSLMGVVSA
ncbi:hypothetical protein AHiyo6_24690, partial [Arthrobacter sp. Hiyo6]